MAGEPIRNAAGQPLQPAFQTPIEGFVPMGRTNEEEIARLRLDTAKRNFSGGTDVAFGTGITTAPGELHPMTQALTDFLGQSSDPRHQELFKQQLETNRLNREELISAEKAFFKLANEIDKLASIPGAGRGGTALPNVRGPQEALRRAEQKTAIFDTAAKERRGRRTGLSASAGAASGSGGVSSSTTALRSVSKFTKTLLGG